MWASVISSVCCCRQWITWCTGVWQWWSICWCAMCEWKRKWMHGQLCGWPLFMWRIIPLIAKVQRLQKYSSMLLNQNLGRLIRITTVQHYEDLKKDIQEKLRTTPWSMSPQCWMLLLALICRLVVHAAVIIFSWHTQVIVLIVVDYYVLRARSIHS